MWPDQIKDMVTVKAAQDQVIVGSGFPSVVCEMPLRTLSKSQLDIFLLAPHLWVFLCFLIFIRDKDLMKTRASVILEGMWVEVHWGGTWHLWGEIFELLGAFLSLWCSGRPAVGDLLPARAGRRARLGAIFREQTPALAGALPCPRIPPGASTGEGRAVAKGQSMARIRHFLIFSKWCLRAGCRGQHKR